MTKIAKTDHAAALMAVLEEIVAGSHGLVSEWALLTLAQAALERGGLEGLARFYRASVEQLGSRAIWIRATLEARERGAPVAARSAPRDLLRALHRPVQRA